MFSKKHTTLEKAIKTAYTHFQQTHPEAVESLFDGHFVQQHLAPVLGQRLNGGCTADVNWVAGLWAAHLGISEPTLKRQLPEISPTITAFLCQLRAELRAKGGNAGVVSLVSSN